MEQQDLQSLQRIRELEAELSGLLGQNDDYQRLQTIPGVGPVVAATLLASVGDARYFKNG
ncbi:MAG: transposase [Candidatus Thiodiazotropha sp. (ex Lucinoma kastoroae)]|nr:transposase [Candidatus Thiodiazotropha sp. (ex Lucinoma kastoroae)]